MCTSVFQVRFHFEKYATCNIANVKSRINNINSYISFKFIDQGNFFKKNRKSD